MTDTCKESHFSEKIEHHLQQTQHLLEKLAQGEEANESLREFHISKPLLRELQNQLNELNTPDLAFILEALPIEQRGLVWSYINADRDGKVLLEVSDAVRETLIATMSLEELRDAAEQLDTSEIADLAPSLPQAVMRDVFKSLSIESREHLRAAMSYPLDTVGAIMDFNMVTIRQDATIESILRYLRRLDNLPDHTDQLFVVDRDNKFKGTLALNKLLISAPEVKISGLIDSGTLSLSPDDDAEHAARSFERYALVSAPVIDEEGKLIGRLSVYAAINFIRAKTDKDALNLAGLHDGEDLFASVWKSAKNRWMWLSLNLCIAFFASRVIAGFEDSIEQLVALATLMPIVGGFARNSGNQTVTVIVHALSLGKISEGNTKQLLVKEISLSLINGIVWGGIAGGFSYLLYKNAALGLVMTGAMILNLLLGAAVGILIPLTLQKLGRDPGFGSNILLTAITTAGGFFIFLGLATIFLLN